MPSPARPLNALPLGARLHEYRVDQVLGAGGFGITYLAHDTHLDKPVAIKEYLPSELAVRAAGGTVAPLSEGKAGGFRWGLDRFLQEARTLARFSHPNIVRVLRYFEGNGTAYMVMEYEKGDSLRNVFILSPQLPEADLKRLLGPLLEGLARVHEAGFLHRDIKPDNIFVRQDGTPVLIDFGAARQALGGETRSLTSILTPGYAPLEQYSGEGRQGPWTDLYALGGVLYRAVTDRNPPDAVTRIRADGLAAGLEPARGRYGEGFLKAIAWALAMPEHERPQSVAQWSEAVLAEQRVAVAPTDQPERRTQRTVRLPPAASPEPAPRPRRRLWPYAAALVAFATFAIGAWMVQRDRSEARRQATLSAEAAHQQAQAGAERAKALAEAERARALAQAERARSIAEAERARAAALRAPAAAGDAPRDRLEAEARVQFKSADADRDGHLSRVEAQRFPVLARNFERVDRNGDGRISPEEFLQARRMQAERAFLKKGG